MNRKELTEIRRRLRAEDSTVTRFYGCYVTPEDRVHEARQESWLDRQMVLER